MLRSCARLALLGGVLALHTGQTRRAAAKSTIPGDWSAAKTAVSSRRGARESEPEPEPAAELNLLFDSRCWVCRMEVDHLTANGAAANGVRFTDVEDALRRASAVAASGAAGATGEGVISP